MTKKECVYKAIEFDNPESTPIWLFNRDQELGDILLFPLWLDNGQGNGTNEWGYHLQHLDDGTMGHPTDPVIQDWAQLKDFSYPTLNALKRSKGIEEFRKISKNHYQLGSMGITGFTTYTFLRGFSDSMMDFGLNSPEALELLDRIFGLETEIIGLAGELGLDGIHFADDWGTQDGLIISPQMWRKIFKPRYKKQFDYAHQKGLHVWFHCCGNIEEIVEDFHEIGVDVMNIAQPNVVNITNISRSLKGKQCFLIPISYQTVSISGTTDEIRAEARRLYSELGHKDGGFIGYVEEYSCMGMSETNYQACISAFRELKLRKNTVVEVPTRVPLKAEFSGIQKSI
jgi:uroporphyrinogen decarboxylase